MNFLCIRKPSKFRTCFEYKSASVTQPLSIKFHRDSECFMASFTGLPKFTEIRTFSPLNSHRFELWSENFVGAVEVLINSS